MSSLETPHAVYLNHYNDIAIIDKINSEISSMEAIHIPVVEPYNADMYNDLYNQCIKKQKKEKQLDYNMAYITKNYNHLAQYIDCDICGKQFQRWNKYSHQKTKYHINRLYLIKDNEQTNN